MRKTRLIAVLSTMAILLAACGSTGGGSKADIKIGSDNFYESKLVAEMYAQVLENAGYKVTRSFGLGSRQERAPAFEEGQVDLVPEYVGSGTIYYDKTKATGDGEQNRAALQAIYDTKGANGGKLAEVLAISPGQDQNVGVVRPDTAQTMNLKSMADLAAVQDQLKWGLPADCDANQACKGALEAYGVTYPPKQREALAACDVPIAEALKGKAIDFAWLCSTQPAIKVNGFTVLTDDKNTQPADNLAPVVREDYISKVDKQSFSALLDAVSATLTTDVLLDLGVKVAVDNQDVADVAKEWLTAQGLLGQ